MTPSTPSTTRNPHNKHKVFKFLNHLLTNEIYSDVIQWVNKEEMIFQIIGRQRFSDLYKVFTGNKSTSFDGIMRSFRSFSKQKLIVRVKCAQSCWQILDRNIMKTEMTTQPAIQPQPEEAKENTAPEVQPTEEELADFLTKPGVMEEVQEMMKKLNDFEETFPFVKEFDADTRVKLFNDFRALTPGFSA